jgi:hypothetical protein
MVHYIRSEGGTYKGLTIYTKLFKVKSLCLCFLKHTVNKVKYYQSLEVKSADIYRLRANYWI